MLAKRRRGFNFRPWESHLVLSTPVKFHAIPCPTIFFKHSTHLYVCVTSDLPGRRKSRGSRARRRCGPVPRKAWLHSMKAGGILRGWCKKIGNLVIFGGLLLKVEFGTCSAICMCGPTYLEPQWKTDVSPRFSRCTVHVEVLMMFKWFSMQSSVFVLKILQGLMIWVPHEKQW